MYWIIIVIHLLLIINTVLVLYNNHHWELFHSVVFYSRTAIKKKKKVLTRYSKQLTLEEKKEENSVKCFQEKRSLKVTKYNIWLFLLFIFLFFEVELWPLFFSSSFSPNWNPHDLNWAHVWCKCGHHWKCEIILLLVSHIYTHISVTI